MEWHKVAFSIAQLTASTNVTLSADFTLPADGRVTFPVRSKVEAPSTAPLN
jgi:hypothetical protein